MYEISRVILEITTQCAFSSPSPNIDEPNNDYSYKLLYQAIISDELEIVELFFQRGLDLNQNGQFTFTPLQLAAGLGHRAIVEFMVKMRVSINATANKWRFTALHLAVWFNRVECVRVLLKYGANVSPEEDVCHPIHIAVIQGYGDAASLLLAYGADVNSRLSNNVIKDFDPPIIRQLWYDHNLPLLHYSILRKFEEITELLLSAGADVHLRTSMGKTTLMQAIEVHDVPLVRDLIVNYKANVNDEDDSGQPVIFFTIYNARRKEWKYCRKEFEHNDKKLEMIKLLVEHGADINSQYTAEIKRDTLVNYLIEYVCNPGLQYVLNYTDFQFEAIDLGMDGPHNQPRNYLIDRDPEFVRRIEEEQRLTHKYVGQTAIDRQLVGLPVDESMAVKYPIDSEIWVGIHSEELEEYKKNSIVMVQYMKKTKIRDSNITFWDLMTCEMDKLVKLVTKKTFKCEKAIEECKDEFPAFVEMMKRRLRSAKKKKMKFNTCVEVLCKLFVDHLPYDCCCVVIGYLNEKELEEIFKLFTQS